MRATHDAAGTPRDATGLRFLNLQKSANRSGSDIAARSHPQDLACYYTESASVLLKMAAGKTSKANTSSMTIFIRRPPDCDDGFLCALLCKCGQSQTKPLNAQGGKLNVGCTSYANHARCQAPALSGKVSKNVKEWNCPKTIAMYKSRIQIRKPKYKPGDK